MGPPVLQVSSIPEDFQVTGDGSSEPWQAVAWTELRQRSDAPQEYQARVKLLYSAKGLYVLMDSTDKHLSVTELEDFDDLWHEDVFEFFLWPDERWPVYFEYEISPLGRELPILIPNFNGKFLGWRPWHYDGPRRTTKAVVVRGGPQQPGAAVEGWSAEVYVPYDLLKPLQNVPPALGTKWRANFYRVDYDGGRQTSWDWARVGKDFHEIEKFGTLEFQ
jgi:hypothetical protein